jgi:hypothetical protein
MHAYASCARVRAGVPRLHSARNRGRADPAHHPTPGGSAGEPQSRATGRSPCVAHALSASNACIADGSAPPTPPPPHPTYPPTHPPMSVHPPSHAPQSAIFLADALGGYFDRYNIGGQDPFRGAETPEQLQQRAQELGEESVPGERSVCAHAQRRGFEQFSWLLLLPALAILPPACLPPNLYSFVFAQERARWTSPSCCPPASPQCPPACAEGLLDAAGWRLGTHLSTWSCVLRLRGGEGRRAVGLETARAEEGFIWPCSQTITTNSSKR